MTERRTYWHLAGLGRRPNDYDIATSKLLYYPGRGLETRPPLAAWFERYQQGTALQCSDWEKFRDPRETTYAKYTDLQRTKEAFVDGALRAAEAAGHDQKLAPAWLAELAGIVPVLRYPAHALQMLAAHAGHLAPSGRIVVAFAFQAADELRRVQWLAYRMRQLRDIVPGFGDDARTRWETDPVWQPLRELIERALVTYDWGEATIVLTCVIKPRFDELFGAQLAQHARRAGDELFANIAFSLGEDARWHRAWTHELLGMALADHPANREPIARWIEHWAPLARRAFAGFPWGDAQRIESAAQIEVA